MSSKLFRRFIRKAVIAKQSKRDRSFGQPPGPPPRPGLTWNPSTRRWRRDSEKKEGKIRSSWAKYIASPQYKKDIAERKKKKEEKREKPAPSNAFKEAYPGGKSDFINNRILGGIEDHILDTHRRMSLPSTLNDWKNEVSNTFQDMHDDDMYIRDSELRDAGLTRGEMYSAIDSLARVLHGKYK